MKMADNFVASCFGKTTMSWALALRAKISMNRSGKRVGIYHCRHCRAWHVGSRKFPRGRK